SILRMRCVNFDYVTLSSLNRHAMAALADMGTLKVHYIVYALRQIAKWRRAWTFGSITLFMSLDFFIYVCPETDPVPANS
ncbi:hypothetical protein K438DRAFT_1840926, partial [Mycena galopus ATCC 62051]